jgi:hypothetical protein
LKSGRLSQRSALRGAGSVRSPTQERFCRSVVLFFVGSRRSQPCPPHIPCGAPLPDKTLEKRNRTKQTLTLNQRLLRVAEDCRARARLLQPGQEQDDLYEKAREFEDQIGVIALIQTPGASFG